MNQAKASSGMSDEQVGEQAQAQVPKWAIPSARSVKRSYKGFLDAWNAPDADHGERKGPFRWTGGRYGLLGPMSPGWASRSGRAESHSEGRLIRAPPGGRHPHATSHLEGAHLREAHLEDAFLSAPLEGADLSEAHLEGAFLSDAHLEGANLSRAHSGAGATISQRWRAPGGRHSPRGASGRRRSPCGHLEGARLERTWKAPTSAWPTWRAPTSARPTWRGSL